MYSGLFPKDSNFMSDSMNAKRVAQALRGNKTDEEWKEYLSNIAEVQVDILNKMVEFAGPEGIRFEISVIEEDGSE